VRVKQNTQRIFLRSAWFQASAAEWVTTASQRRKTQLSIFERNVMICWTVNRQGHATADGRLVSRSVLVSISTLGFC